MKNLILTILIFLSFINASAVRFKTFRVDSMILLDKKYADYSGSLELNDSRDIIIDNSKKLIIIKGVGEFEFMSFPRWDVKPTFRVCQYECINPEDLEKIRIYLFQYDNYPFWRLLIKKYDSGVSVLYNLIRE